MNGNKAIDEFSDQLNERFTKIEQRISQLETRVDELARRDAKVRELEQMVEYIQIDMKRREE